MKEEAAKGFRPDEGRNEKREGLPERHRKGV
jgi:hypothetical protein